MPEKMKSTRGYQPWFCGPSLLKDNAQYIKGKVIDLGCGGRQKKRGLILSLPNVVKYTGLDYCGDVDIVADLDKPLPIADNEYDTAILGGTLTYLKEPQSALKEINRILKPHSYLLLWSNWIFPYEEEYSYHTYFRFSDEALRYILEKAGFQVVYICSLGGKMRIIIILLLKWLRCLTRFRPYINKLFGAKKNSVEKNAPVYFVIAKKL